MSIVQNYGHYWSKDAIVWGRPGESGALWGYAYEERKPVFTDFREQIAIYVLYSLQREIVYLGQVGRGDSGLFSRLKNHARGELRDRWTNFSWFGFRRVNKKIHDGDTRVLSEIDHSESGKSVSSKDALDQFESLLLQIVEPRLNKQGPRWGDAQEFMQFVPWEWDYEDGDLKGFPLHWENQILLDRLRSIEAQIKSPANKK